MHCYKENHYNKFISPHRLKEDGVPPLIELEEEVLIGSISPLLRITFFRKYDFAFILEQPCQPTYKTVQVYLKILNIIAGSKDRFEILDKLESNYPTATFNARKYFLEFNNTTILLFREAIQTKLSEIHSLLEYIKMKASQMNIIINDKQAMMIAQSVLLYKKYHHNLDNSW